MGIYTKTPVRNPVNRLNSYPSQKPIHPTDISFQETVLNPGQEIVLQVNGRTVLYPIFKLMSTPRGNLWSDAIADLEIFYDQDITNVYIKNVTICILRIKFKIV
jgi:hypothetical protein